MTKYARKDCRLVEVLRNTCEDRFVRGYLLDIAVDEEGDVGYVVEDETTGQIKVIWSCQIKTVDVNTDGIEKFLQKKS